MSNSKRKIFLLHFAGGSRYSYQFLSPYLETFDLRPLELPGRGKRHQEKLLERFTDALDDITSQIEKEIEPDVDLIFGHSLGAILGFWVTERLEKINKKPGCLIVSGNASPAVGKSDFLQSLHQLPEAEFASALRKMGGIPEELFQNKDLYKFYEPILRADLKLVDSVGGLMPGLIRTSIFAMMGHQEKSAHRIEQWQSFTIADFEYKCMEGGHFFIYQHPEKIANIIQDIDSSKKQVDLLAT
ncbi:thioesterase II family protein [Dyadobacter tibetensis]|uniref:thioesterase II family protein n=1 Tax=Dyadobacter tibetensis TaxID=1211851 RepID=UPI0004B66738|nr:alpha/beta fold hydrolase [Dyadobacter tibetensis]